MISDWRSLACGLLLSAATVLGSPVRARPSYAVKDTHPVPSRWTNVGTPSADHMVRLTIGLKQSRFDELERHLNEGNWRPFTGSSKRIIRVSSMLTLLATVSDPFHHRYGQHLSKAEVDELVRPSDEALELVHDWLLDHDVEQWELQYSAAKDFIKLSLPVAEVERLLDTKYSIFEHVDGTRLVRTPEYSLPVHLHKHVSVITPTNQFLKSDPLSRDIRVKLDAERPPLPSFVPQPANSSVAAVCNFSLVTPDCLRTIYGTINYTAQVPGKNKVALTDYLGEVNDRSDVAQFLQLYRPEAAAAADQFAKISIAGGPINNLNSTEIAAGTGVEGNLDAETILG
jgi:tripeptidyl-peptidase-1